LFPLLDRLEKKAIWDHRSKGMAVKATRVSDGADRNELAVATLLWQRQQGQQ
jgi:hypothetical protein